MASDPQSGYVIRQMRDAILDTDLKIMQLINQRLTQVKRLRDYKEAQGIPFVDPERERWMHQYLQGANRGPLSSEGLDGIYDRILELTKLETAEGD
jgi:chorismate mutase